MRWDGGRFARSRSHFRMGVPLDLSSVAVFLIRKSSGSGLGVSSECTAGRRGTGYNRRRGNSCQFPGLQRACFNIHWVRGRGSGTRLESNLGARVSPGILEVDFCFQRYKRNRIANAPTNGATRDAPRGRTTRPRSAVAEVLFRIKIFD